MNAKQNLYEMQLQLVDIFKAQNLDTGFFNVVFEIDGKKLYAHRFRLSGISPTLNSMLSDRWNSNANEPINVETYKYEEFKELLTFIYSGECNITDENIYDLLDMAEFYGVNVFKNACEKYLSKMEIDINNFFLLLDIADKYSIVRLRKLLDVYLSKNFTTLIQAEAFLKIKKAPLKNIVEIVRYTVVPEKLFEEIFKWAEKQAIKKKNVDENIVLNKVIKEELTDILPLMNFQRMDFEFLLAFVVKKPFLFSSEDFEKIHFAAYSKAHVTVTDPNGKTMKGILNVQILIKL